MSMKALLMKAAAEHKGKKRSGLRAKNAMSAASKGKGHPNKKARPHGSSVGGY